MSKSKGNTIDPLDLIDGITFETLLAKSTQGLLKAEHRARIEKYVRAHFPQASRPSAPTRCASPSLARELRHHAQLRPRPLRGYRNFCNKLWNATRSC